MALYYITRSLVTTVSGVYYASVTSIVHSR